MLLPLQRTGTLGYLSSILRIGVRNGNCQPAIIDLNLRYRQTGGSWVVCPRLSNQRNHGPRDKDFGEYESEENNKGLHVDDWDYGKLDHVCDIINIPEKDHSFDAILCTEVIEHIPYPHLAIEEFSRLLRPGGTLLLSAPFLSLTHFAPYHFSTGFNRYYYETLLPKAGFEVNEISCNGNFFELVAQEVRRVSSVADRYAGSQVTPQEFSAMQQVLQMLERFSGEDSGSEELACFGLQVIATRQEVPAAAKATSAIENAVS